jgi:dipeptidyl aminopeptidase/acylaminoacyl peptidase
VRSVDGRRQVHVLPMDGGEARRVTDLPLGVVGSARWAGPGHLLVVTRLLDDEPTLAATTAWRDAADERPNVRATERRLSRAWDTWYVDPLTEHVLLVDVHDDDAAPRDCTPGTWVLPDPLRDPAKHADVSPDGRWLAFTTSDPDGDHEGVPVLRLYVVDLDQDEPAVRCLTAEDAGHAGPPRFLPDGSLVVELGRERDFYATPTDLWRVDVQTGTRTPLLVDTDDPLGELAIGPDGRIVVSSERRGRSLLFEVIDGALHPLPAPATGGVSAPVVTRLGVFASEAGITAPPEVALIADGAVTRVSAFTEPPLDGVDLGRVEERTVTGAEGDDIQVLLLHPPAALATNGPAPLVHLIHGGPHSAFGDTWHWRWCAARFAAEGFLVAMVNFHGSTGFGHAFTRSTHGDWATAPTIDVEAATDDLVTAGLADPDRMAITGGSYGGYLTVWLTTHTDRYATAVAHAAVTDFAGMWATDDPSGFGGAFGARLWEDPAATMRASPSWHYGSMATPMLVLHGDRDLRVPIDQGRALYGVLQEMRIESRLVVFPDENHWVLDRRSSVRWYDEVLGWLHRHLD